MAKFNLKTLNLDDGFHLITAVAKASGCKESNPSKGIYYLVGENAEYRYVSLGDSIAVGHSIDDKWADDYGYHTQYGEKENTYTKIVPNSYTDLIKNNLKNQFVQGEVSAISYAHSGDMVEDLIKKLDQPIVRNSIENANLVTVCIGANDVLQPALSELGNYINYGTPALGVISQTVQTKIDILNDDSNANSYTALLNKLYSINPNANYVFTTIYNPLKYLWLDESTASGEYKDGFFGPVMWTVPDGLLGSGSIQIRKQLLNTEAVQTVFDRINGPSRDGSDGLSAWTETYITKLNQVLKNKISAFGKSNFIIADTKALYDTFPDRDRPKDAPYHYNDIVNVEFTRNFNIEKLDWQQFWDNIDWWNVALGALSIDFEGLMQEFILNIVNYVIVPDIDPHPETYGHYALYRSFADSLDWESLSRYTISYNANGGTGDMASQVLVGIDKIPAYITLGDSSFVAPSEIHRFEGWNTLSNGNGTAYKKGQVMGITSDISLYAQWSGTCTVTVSHSLGDSLPNYGSGDTGPLDYYAYSINGVIQDNLGVFSNPARVHELPIGTVITVAVNTEYGDKRAYIEMNGKSVPYLEGVNFPAYSFTLTSNVNIHFEWNNWYEGVSYQSYWNCYITTN